MKVKIFWQGLTYTQDAEIISARHTDSCCGGECWEVEYISGDVIKLHEIMIYTESRPFGYWAESILSSDNTGKITESFRLVEKMEVINGLCTNDIDSMLARWNKYHTRKGHKWVNSLNLFGGYWRDEEGTTFELM